MVDVWWMKPLLEVDVVDAVDYLKTNFCKIKERSRKGSPRKTKFEPKTSTCMKSLLEPLYRKALQLGYSLDSRQIHTP